MKIEEFERLAGLRRQEAQQIVEEGFDLHSFLDAEGNVQVLGDYRITSTLPGSDGVHQFHHHLSEIDPAGSVLTGKGVALGGCCICRQLGADLYRCSCCRRLVHFACGKETRTGEFRCRDHVLPIAVRSSGVLLRCLWTLLRWLLSPFVHLEERR